MCKFYKILPYPTINLLKCIKNIVAVFIMLNYNKKGNQIIGYPIVY